MDKDQKTSPRLVQPVVTITSLRSSGSDFVYWQSQPYTLRLVTLEQIRQEYHQWRFGAQLRLLRVYRITKR